MKAIAAALIALFLVARLLGESPRIESLAFSPNGKFLAVAGSAPARFKPSSPTSNIKVGSVVTQSRRMSPALHVDRRLLAGSPEQSVPHLVGRRDSSTPTELNATPT